MLVSGVKGRAKEARSARADAAVEGEASGIQGNGAANAPASGTKRTRTRSARGRASTSGRGTRQTGKASLPQTKLGTSGIASACAHTIAVIGWRIWTGYAPTTVRGAPLGTPLIRPRGNGI